MKIQDAAFVASYGLLKQIPPSQKMEIVFSGRSNVGKSSLINKLFNRKGLARVSGIPGKTATINFYEASDIHFVDLPGYGYAKVSKSEKKRWSQLIEGYFKQDRQIVLVFQLVDMRHPPSKQDVDMINYLIEIEMPFIIVLTKSDKLSKNQQLNRLQELQKEVPYADQITMVPFSSVDGQGVQELYDIIDDVTNSES